MTPTVVFRMVFGKKQRIITHGVDPLVHPEYLHMSCVLFVLKINTTAIYLIQNKLTAKVTKDVYLVDILKLHKFKWYELAFVVNTEKQK